jgi:hypothetical protein
VAHTTDGWRISTVEQYGRYAGEELGKVWLKDPACVEHARRPRTDTWIWFSIGTPHEAAVAAAHATTMTAEAFERSRHEASSAR